MGNLPRTTTGRASGIEQDSVRGTHDVFSPRAELLYRVVPSAILTVDQDRKITSWNLEAAKVAGYSEAEVIGRPCTTFAASPCDERCGLFSPDEPKPIVGSECTIRRKDGQVRVIRKNADLLRDEAGNAIGGIESFEDVTDRKKVEETLSMFKLGIDRSSDAVFMTDTAGKILYANPAFQGVYGYSPEEALGKTPRILESGLLSPAAYEHFWDTLLDGKIVAGEITNKTRDGRLITTEVSNNPIVNQKGEMIGFLAIHRDITDRKLAEQALRESEACSRELFENAIDIVYTHDLAGNFTSLNRAGELVSGYSIQQDGNLNISQIMAPDQAERAREIISRLVADPAPMSCELGVIAKDGRRVTLEMNARAMHRDGKPVGIQGIARDVTEAREATRRLAQSVADLEAVHQTALSLNTVRDLEGLLRETLRGLSRVTAPDRARVLVLEHDGSAFSMRAELDETGALQVTPDHHQPGPLSRAILDGREAHFVVDVEGEGALRSSSMTASVQAYAGVPLLTPDHLIGLLYLTYDRPHEFPHDTRNIIQIVASHAAVAVANIQMFEEAERAATTDALTRLPNHRHLMEQLDHEMTRATRSGHPLSLMMIDVDDFKLVNDAHGHPVGDRLLREVAQVLQNALRTTDIVGRYGGDEFLAILPETDQSAAKLAGERLLSAVRAIRFVVPREDIRVDTNGSTIPVGLSVGISTYPYDSATRLELISLADTAMYSSKQAGGNAVTSADATDSGFLADQNSTFSVLEGLVNAVDTKDHYTRLHSEQVAHHALRLAEAVGLTSDQKRMLRVAGLLHDVGKIGIPDHILRKPGPLNQEEREIICQHPLLGEMIIREVPHLVDIMDMVRHHHERYDGDGYPEGLHGDQIPLLSRIIAVADSYSAMTLDRPYRSALSKEEAISELRKCAGTQFDPEVVSAFLRSLALDDPPKEARETIADQRGEQ